MTSGAKIAIVLAGLAVGGVSIAVLSRRAARTRFVAALPAAGRPFGEFIWAAARRRGIKPAILAAVISHESGFGTLLTPRGPRGKGDGGHGHGLGQIDDRTWGAWLASHDWGDPKTNIEKSAEILAAALAQFPGNVIAGIASYNANADNVRRAIAAGKPADSVTTHDKDGRSYVVNVAAQLERITARAAA